MKRSAVIRVALVVAALVLGYTLQSMTAELLGIHSVGLYLIPIITGGWLLGTWAGLALGISLLVYTGTVFTPNLDQWVLLGIFAGLGPLAGFGAVFKRGFDRHQRASSAARFDALTGLQTRGAFMADLQEAIQQAAADGTKLSVLFVDLDRFKIVNDSFGHDAGDRVLRITARRLQDNLRTGEFAGRYAGDEFVLAFPETGDANLLAARASRLLRNLGQSIDMEGSVITVGASIGISVYPDDGTTADGLIRYADRAMYQVKSNGKNHFHFSTNELRQRRARQLEIEQRMGPALERGEFQLYYQPQIDLRNGELHGFEALVRWYSPELGSVPPEEFISQAEETGFIVSLGHWLMREACRQLAMWQSAGLDVPKLAVNASPLQFMHPRFVQQVRAALEDSGARPQNLEVEITEGLLLADTGTANLNLHKLATLGVGTVLDDFGTGHSSLSYLERMPISSLKVPGSFVSNIGRAPRSGAIIEAICALAHKLGKKVTAEGIETEAQLKFLQSVGCDYGQGYLMSAALSADRATRLLAGRQTQRMHLNGDDGRDPIPLS